MVICYTAKENQYTNLVEEKNKSEDVSSILMFEKLISDEKILLLESSLALKMLSSELTH